MELSNSPSGVVAAIERLLKIQGPDITLGLCAFHVSAARDSGRLTLHVHATSDEARQHFAAHGNRFFEPRLVVSSTAPDGTVIDWRPPPPKPPLLSDESVPAVGDENRLWRGYGHTTRGVIKMRTGRFTVDLNLPSVAEAEALARLVAEALEG